MAKRILVVGVAMMWSCGGALSDPPPSGAGVASTVASPPSVERGEYLASLLGCKYCHMNVGESGPDFTRPFAGGLEVRETFGTWRAPNITQHRESGIGAWSDREIAKAIREGVRPDGSHLYPVMPYASFHRLTDDDTQALVAYLRTVPPVDHAVAPNDLQLAQPTVGSPRNEIDPITDPVKHGEYLVTVMNCSMCHTPLGEDGLPDASRHLAGGVAIRIPALGSGTLYASNLTTDRATGLGAWSAEDLLHGLQMPGVGGTRISGYLGSWSEHAAPPITGTTGTPMTGLDLAAITAYLRTLPPIPNAVPRSTFRITGWHPSEPLAIFASR